MKKVTLFSILTLAIFTVSIITLNSCKKEEENQTAKISFEDGTFLAEKINQFKHQLEEVKDKLKSTETIGLDEAIENMELLINASHGFPFEEYTSRKTDVVSFQLSTDINGDVNLSDVSTAYDEMINLVKEAYNNSGFADKGLIIVTLALDAEDKSGETINATVTTGKSGSKETEIFEDCWFYGEDDGFCDGSQFGGIMDGGDTIANIIASNNPINDWFDCPGENYHLVLDPHPMIKRYGHEYPDGNGGYLIFFYPDEDNNGFTDEEKMLYSEDMNYYYDNEFQIIYTTVPQEYNYTFPEHVLVTCVIDGFPFNNPENGGMLTLHHQNELTYAHRYWVEDAIIDPPTPID